MDEGGRVLVWTGGTDTPPSPSPSTPPALQPVTPEAPIYHWFTEGFDTADLQEARTLIEALEA